MRRSAVRMSRTPATPVISCPSTTFSATLRTGTSMKCWWTMPMPRAIASAGPWIATGVPSIRISPSSGVTRPYRMFIRVVLPAPFSPRSAWISRSPSSRSIASFASVPPGKRLVMPRISRTDVLSLMTKAGRPEGRPASNSPTGSGSRDRLELAGLHVVGGLRELVRQSGRDRIEIPDRGRADAVVGRVIGEVPGLLALVFEALDRVARRVLKVLLRAGDDAGGGVRERQVLIDIDADAVDLGIARCAEHARAGEAGDLKE